MSVFIAYRGNVVYDGVVSFLDWLVDIYWAPDLCDPQQANTHNKYFLFFVFYLEFKKHIFFK